MDVWCNNRALNSITFENCKFDGVSVPTKIICPDGESINFALKNCVITAENGKENENVIELYGKGEIRFADVKLIGFNRPTIKCGEGCGVTVCGGTPIRRNNND